MSKPTGFPFQVLERPEASGLSAAEKLLLVYLAWRQGRNPDTWPSLRRIERDLGFGRRTCLRSIDRLVEARCIAKTSGKCGRGHSNRYVILPTEKEAERHLLPDEKRAHPDTRKGGKYAQEKVASCALNYKRTKDITTSSSEDEGDEELFGLVWAAYPKREFRAEAMAAWRQLNPSPELAERILESVQEHTESVRWTRSLAEDGGRFVPTLGTFLAKRRWEDTPPAKPEPQRGDKDWLPSDAELDRIFANLSLSKEAE